MKTVLAQKDLHADGDGYLPMTNMVQSFNKRYEHALEFEDIEQVVTGNPYFGNNHIYGKLLIKGDPHHYSHTQTHKRTQTFVRYQHQQ